MPARLVADIVRSLPAGAVGEVTFYVPTASVWAISVNNVEIGVETDLNGQVTEEFAIVIEADGSITSECFDRC